MKELTFRNCGHSQIYFLDVSESKFDGYPIGYGINHDINILY